MIRVVRILQDVYFGVAVICIGLSLVGVLFVNAGARMIGIAAFLFLVPGLLWANRYSLVTLPNWLRRTQLVAAIGVGLLLVIAMILRGGRGYAELGDLPVLAVRDQYDFARDSDVPRWRFVVEEVAIHLALYGVMMAVAINQWTVLRLGHLKKRGPARSNPFFQGGKASAICLCCGIASLLGSFYVLVDTSELSVGNPAAIPLFVFALAGTAAGTRALRQGAGIVPAVIGLALSCIVLVVLITLMLT